MVTKLPSSRTLIKDPLGMTQKIMSQGATPEIEAALNLCVEEIFTNQEIEESTGAIRRDEIRRYM